MVTRFGLDNFKDNSVNGSLLLLKPGETRTVRFIQEPSEMAIIKRHWVKDRGYIHCIGVECPLCPKASAEWGAPITSARDYFLAALIDRSDDKVRVFEGGKTIKDKLLNFSRLNNLTHFDVNIRRDGKKGKDTYDLTPIFESRSQLTQDEKARIKEIDLNWMLKRGEKSKEEMHELIEENQAF